MSSMTYKGYTALIELDEHDSILWGKVLGLPDEVSITFEGETVAALRADFHRAIDFYLEDCTRTGCAPRKPASGRLMLRIPPETHGAALVAAQAAGKSLNQWASEVLRKAASR